MVTSSLTFVNGGVARTAGRAAGDACEWVRFRDRDVEAVEAGVLEADAIEVRRRGKRPGRVEADFAAEIVGKRGIESVAEHVVDHQDAMLRVEPGCHRPFDIAWIADVDVVVHHGHHLERREGRESRHQRLLGPARALLRELHHGMIETAAAVGEVDVPARPAPASAAGPARWPRRAGRPN